MLIATIGGFGVAKLPLGEISRYKAKGNEMSIWLLLIFANCLRSKTGHAGWI